MSLDAATAIDRVTELVMMLTKHRAVTSGKMQSSRG
jgi:hypothetical protein